jgi:hypothetical protein
MENKEAIINEEAHRIWSRQQDVLQQISEYEKMILEGEKIQNPYYDVIYGSKRNSISLSLIIQGCEGILRIISPSIKDPKPPKPRGSRDEIKVLKGQESNTYKKYRTQLSEAQKYINQGIAFNKNPVISNSRYQRAYAILKEITYQLRRETHELGYDFQKEDSPLNAWQN